MASKVAEILSEMARNAGDAALRRGALIGNAVNQVGQMPAQYYAEQDRKRFDDLHVAQVQQQMGLEAARGARETQLAKHQDVADAHAAQTEQHLNTIISAGFQADPNQFDMPSAVKAAQGLGRADLIPTIAAVHDKLTKPPTILKEGEAGFDPVTHQPIAGMSVEPKPTEADIALKAAGGDPTTAMGFLKPKPSATAEQDDARYRDIQARGSQNLPVLPMEKAWADAYEKQKTLGVNKSASAAADRQTATIGAQVAQQKRSQDFTQLQAARADIEKNVQTPYLTARASANTLRDVVTAAQAGNKVAGSLQALETTMAAIRAQGLNRINRTETDMTGNAGSLFDRISGYVGKKLEGQPVPADIQKDMLAFSDILENAAYKKYLAGHKASTDLYGVTDKLQPSLPAPVPSGGVSTPLTPGLQGLQDRK